MSDQATMNPQTGDDSGAVEQDQAVVDQQTTDTSSTESQGQTESKQQELPKWHYQLPGQLQGNEHLSQYSTLGDLAQKFVDLQAKSDRLVELPGEDADDEAKAAFYRSLGRPDEPDGYELSTPENREELGFTDEADAAYRQKAHELGLSKEQAEQLHAWQLERTGSALDAMKQQQKAAQEEGIQNLRKEWGDRFDERIAKAQRAFQHFGGEELLQYLKDTGQNESPALIKSFVELYEKTSDDSLVAGDRDKYGNTAVDWYPTMED